MLPELWACGYDAASLAEDAAGAAEPLDGPRITALAGLARRYGIVLFAGTVPERAGSVIYNTAPVIDGEGRLIGRHRKAHLYPVTGEPQVFAAGDSLTTLTVEPLGPVGLIVCFDGDLPEVPAALARRGAATVVAPSAYEAEAAAWWDLCYPAAAVTNGQWWVQANQCGTTPSGTLLGASRVIDPAGRVVAEAGRVPPGGDREPEVLVCRMQEEASHRAARAAAAIAAGARRPGLY